MRDVLILTLILVGTVSLTLWGAYKLDRAQCLAAYQSFEPTYGFVEGCIITADGRRIPAKALRVENPA